MNILLGANGSGKTNLQDAIHYLCIGKSYFASNDRYIVAKEQEAFSVIGNFKGQQSFRIKALVELGKQKSLSIDDNKYDRLSDHMGICPVVVVAPSDILLLTDGSDERRKLMDRTIIQYDKKYLEQLMQYNHLLKQRNALLKQFKENNTFNELLLESISEKMYPLVAYLHSVRKDFTKELSERFKSNYDIISASKEYCQIEYHSKLHEHDIQYLFKKAIEKDRVLARTTCGIHKDDLHFFINDSLLKPYASQGQLKSFIMAIKLAQYDIIRNILKIPPILILDDIFDKLDDDRVSDLLRLCLSNPIGQVFISDTSIDKIPDLLKSMNQSAHIFVIKDGTLKKTYESTQ